MLYENGAVVNGVQDIIQFWSVFTYNTVAKYCLLSEDKTRNLILQGASVHETVNQIRIMCKSCLFFSLKCAPHIPAIVSASMQNSHMVGLSRYGVL